MNAPLNAPVLRRFGHNWPLTFASGDYDRLRALRDGRVKVEGCDLSMITMATEFIFPRALQRGEFDVTELSLSSYLLQVARGNCDYIALPVFISRAFRHRAIYVRTDRGIDRPQDLAGKRVGMPEFQTTIALWLKGILQDEFHLDLASLIYVPGGVNRAGRKERLPLNLPDHIRLEPIGPAETLSDLLDAGAIDAVFAPDPPESFYRNPKIARLFPDYVSAEADYHRRTGNFPIMHLIAVRRAVLEKQPWIAEALFRALVEAKRIAFADMREMVDKPANHTILPWLAAEFDRTLDIMGDNYWRYGVAANRGELETACRYSFEQFLSPRRLTIDDLFFPGSEVWEE